MARLFISHSSANNAAACQLRDWLAANGFDDVFLDVDPARGLVAGERWQEALKAAADRCEAVLFLVSPAWIESKWCLAEFLLAKTLHKRIFGLLVEAVPLERVPVEMTAEWQLCDLTAARGQAPAALSSGGLDLLRRGLARAGLDPQSFPWPPAADPGRAPYRGLRALEAEDAAIFFGRDAMIVRGLDRLRGLVEDGVDPLMVVLGASGSGKSSFLRAGLLPRLAREDAMFLVLPVIRPETVAVTGEAGLALALAGAFARLGAARAPGRIKEQLGAESGALGRLCGELIALAGRRLVHLGPAAADPVVVVSIDQAEELFNAEGAAEGARLLELLAGLLTAPPAPELPRVVVLMTMRSDRYERLQGHAAFAALRRQLFDLPPIPAAEYKTVIEGPARRVVESGGRLAIDPALTEQLIADAGGADALPLLSFTLERLYADFGREGRLTLAEYQRQGGVQGSIEAAIAQAFTEPGRAPAIPSAKDAQLACVRAAFIPWLARIAPDTGVPMRRLARLEEIPEGSRAVVERLVAARLLVADRRGGVDLIEVAHESLLRQWSALAAWLEADAGNLKVLEGVERAAGEWARNGREIAWLDHRAERLAVAERLTSREDFRRRIGADGSDYLTACRAREDAERREREAALERERARLAEVAAAQAHTARTQRVARWSLGAAGAAVVIGLGLLAWQHRTNLALEASLGRQRAALALEQTNLFVELSVVERLRGNPDAALRFAVNAARLDGTRTPGAASLAGVELATAVLQAGWTLSLGGHEGSVSSAAFSPDGARVVTASQDRTARIWDAKTGQSLAVLRGHEGGLWTAVFSPDGSQVLTAAEDGTARLWNAATGAPLAVFLGHEGKVTCAAFSPDGRRMVTGSFDHTARIWDVASAAPVAVLRGHENTVQTAVFSADGRRIVTASDDTTARIWDAATGTALAVLRGHQNAVYAAVFSPDGTRVATGSDDTTARIWEVATTRTLQVLRGHDDYVNSVEFSPDGARLLTSSADRTARIWDAQSGAALEVLRGHEDFVNTAAYSADGRRIITASRDLTARIWDSVTATELLVLRGHENWAQSARYSPDGTRIVTASADKTARVWDAATGRELLALRGHEAALWSATFSPDSQRIVTAAEDKTARLWDAATGRALAVLTGHGNWVMDAVFSPDGRTIATASWDQTARLWDAATGTPGSTLRGHTNIVRAIAFSPDGKRVVTASDDRTARVWDVTTGMALQVLRGHDGAVYSAAFSPDGQRIVTASQDRTARVWDAASGTTLTSLHGHEDVVWWAEFSPDGRRIVTGSEDKTARIWDAASAREIGVLRGHDNWVVHAAWSPDGARVVTASRDNTARIWNAELAEASVPQLVADACHRRLGVLSTLTRDDMQLAGFPESAPKVDICEGVP